MKSRIEELALDAICYVPDQIAAPVHESALKAITTAVNETLELAAKECEKKGKRIGDSDCHWGPEYANRIRNLKV